MDTKTESVSIKTIPLADAKQWANAWQTQNPNKCKAFLIPTRDLIASLQEMGIIDDQGVVVEEKIASTGIRTYMAIDNTNGIEKDNGYGEKLLIVGTYVDCTDTHRDIIEDADSTGCDTATPKPIGTGVFDFTDPCPTTCDRNSPLFDPKG